MNVLLHSIDPVYETLDFRKYNHPWVDSAYQDMQISSPIRDEGIAVATQVAYTGEVRMFYCNRSIQFTKLLTFVCIIMYGLVSHLKI